MEGTDWISSGVSFMADERRGTGAAREALDWWAKRNWIWRPRARVALNHTHDALRACALASPDCCIIPNVSPLRS